MPERERSRIAALHEYRLLDSPAGDELDAVVRVAAAVAGVPYATLNLIDDKRQCQLTSVGFEGGDSDRADSMCAVHFEAGRFTHVRDASVDPVYRDNPWVNGTRFSTRFYASAPLVTPEGHALGSLCVFDVVPRDLTGEQIARLEDLARIVLALFERRRQARVNTELATLAEERQRWTDTLLDTIDVAVVAVGPDGRLTLFNRAAREWHGVDADPDVEPAEVAHRYRLFETDGHTPLPEERVPLLRVLREGAVRNAEMIIKPDGADPVHVSVSGRALTGADGVALGAVVAMNDVTGARAQQRAIEEARRELAAANTELRRSNADLANFAGAVSHDLVAPLAAVGAYLELIGDEVEGRPRKWVEAATRAVNRMRELIRSLLDYAQAGSAPVRLGAADLADLFEQVRGDLAPAAEAAGAVVEAPGPLPVATGDPVLIRQLLQNLVGNSIKYRDPRRPCRVTVTAERAGHGWTVRVADNGLGIPPEQRERVFDMFTRLGNNTAGGHGIGLSTCWRIVERHGGVIRVDETPGGGTTVSFTLPGTPPDPSEQG
ncbi:PAS domain-containing protein [Actinoplanes sp. NEAU-H7]|uniref:Sensor-like histidine kinase SenX3 n=1 Tax=Actinoplanes flavus TaxID=2820290 RepID=A0ABS3UR38_9ACTN|nr:PAS domain-containing protein [Actinoplanes flavus]